MDAGAFSLSFASTALLLLHCLALAALVARVSLGASRRVFVRTLFHHFFVRFRLLHFFLLLPASDIAIACACLRSFTFGPLFAAECSVPRLNSPMTLCSLVFLGMTVLLKRSHQGLLLTWVQKHQRTQRQT